VPILPVRIVPDHSSIPPYINAARRVVTNDAPYVRSVCWRHLRVAAYAVLIAHRRSMTLLVHVCAF